MAQKFVEGQWVKLIGGEKKMRVVNYDTKKELKRNPFESKLVDTGILTGQVQCVWINATYNTEVYDYFDEKNLESCD